MRRFDHISKQHLTGYQADRSEISQYRASPYVRVLRSLKPCRGGILLIFFLLMSLTVSLGQNSSVIQVNSKIFNELISENDGILLDVRTTMEFKNGHIPNSGNLNFYAFDFRKNLTLLPKGQPIYLYCNTGYRSEKAAEILIRNGYTDIYNLQHGIMEWELIDLPVIVEPDARPDNDNKILPEQYYAAIQSDSLVFIDFYAPWCGPCRKMMPVIDSLKVDYHKEIKILKVNVDASKRLVKDLKLAGVPYLVLFRNGKIRYSKNDYVGRNELTAILEQNILEYSRSKSGSIE